jgi:hypothetical protein
MTNPRLVMCALQRHLEGATAKPDENNCKSIARASCARRSIAAFEGQSFSENRKKRQIHKYNSGVLGGEGALFVDCIA